jgi:Na+/melibiose symporter-like transporter
MVRRLTAGQSHGAPGARGHFSGRGDAISQHHRNERVTNRVSPSRSVSEMLSSAKLRLVLSIVLGVVSLALFVRGVGYYVGSGPHDGEDLPSFLTFLAGSAVLFVAVVLSWNARPGRRTVWVVGVCLSGVLLLLMFAWWALNVMLEQWAS